MSILDKVKGIDWNPALDSKTCFWTLSFLFSQDQLFKKNWDSKWLRITPHFAEVCNWNETLSLSFIKKIFISQTFGKVGISYIWRLMQYLNISRQLLSFAGIKRELEKVKKAMVAEKAKEKQMYARMFASWYHSMTYNVPFQTRLWHFDNLCAVFHLTF